MRPDLVIDTNVLVHASNPGESRQQECIDLINYLLESSEQICLDEGFDFSENLNKSHIGYEYIKHLKHGMLGHVLIVSMAQSKRVVEVSKTVPAGIAGKINQSIVNKHDRVFIKVALNSESRILISNDFTDFSKSKRKHIRKEIGVQVVVPNEYDKIVPERPEEMEDLEGRRGGWRGAGNA